MTPALRYVVACCRWPDDDRRRSAIADAAAAVVDWQQVRRVAYAHRVEGLVAQGTAAAAPQLAPDVHAEFSRTAEQVKAQALADVGATLRVARAIEAAKLDYCILKGSPLGVQAYGTPTLKQSWDIDLLVEPRDAVGAAEVLAQLGFEPRVPARPFTNAEFRRWSTVSKEAEFEGPDGRTVELHWSLCDHPMLLPRLGAAEAEAEVELHGGRTVRTLNDEATIAYLAVHGAFHGWSRLKWLADFAAFVASRCEAERSRLLDAAREFGTGLALDQALLLSNMLLGSTFETGPSSAQAEDLARSAAWLIERRASVPAFDTDPAAAKAIRGIQLKLGSSRRYRAILRFRAIRGSEDRRLLGLPGPVSWAYWLIRPFTGSWRTVRRFSRGRGRRRARSGGRGG